MSTSNANDGKPIYGRAVLASFQETVDAAGTAQQINTDNGSVAGVFIKPLSGNAGDIYFGDSTVDSDGFVVSPTDPMFFYPCAKLSDVYMDAANNDDGASFWPV